MDKNQRDVKCKDFSPLKNFYDFLPHELAIYVA